METKDIIVLLVFHVLLFFCWWKMILFVKKRERKYVKMVWAFIGLYFLLFFLQWYVSGLDVGGNTLGIKVPMYLVFGLLLIYLALRIIPPMKAEMIRRIKNIMSES